MTVSYTYSFVNDFPGGFESISFAEDITNSGVLTPYFRGLNKVDGDLQVIFTQALTAEEKQTLDTIVQNHIPRFMESDMTPVRIISDAPDGKTQNQYFARTITVLDVGPGETKSNTRAFPYGAGFSVCQIQANDNNIGDVLSLHLAPDTVVGALTAECKAGDTTFNVPPVTFTAVNIAALITINNQEVGEIVALDPQALTITTSQPIASGHPAGTPVLATRVYVQDFYINCAGTHMLGSATLADGFIPPNVEGKLVYTNNHPTDTHSIAVTVELRI